MAEERGEVRQDKERKRREGGGRGERECGKGGKKEGKKRKGKDILILLSNSVSNSATY